MSQWDKHGDDECKLELITTCVGFDDLLEETLSLNMPHVDNAIVVTAHDDKRVRMVANKFGAHAVTTDLFKKNGRNFNKGAAINAGLAYFQYWGWRLHLDSDIALPCNFRRVLFNHTHLEKDCLYGCDRFDVVGKDNINKMRDSFKEFPQARNNFLVDPTHGRSDVFWKVGGRSTTPLDGYTPLGFFQLWHHTEDRPYPYSRGTAAHDDLMFSRLWPESKRRHLPTVACYHLCPRRSRQCENWDGHRRMPRLDEPKAS